MFWWISKLLESLGWCREKYKTTYEPLFPDSGKWVSRNRDYQWKEVKFSKPKFICVFHLEEDINIYVVSYPKSNAVEVIEVYNQTELDLFLDSLVDFYGHFNLNITVHSLL